MKSDRALLDAIQVIYEDADIVVIHKPVGLRVHEDGRLEGPTVVDWFLSKYPDARGVGEPKIGKEGTPLERSGVVHRLDTDTSGVLLLVKNTDAFVHIKEQFKNRLIRKEYRAFVYGTMKEKWGTISRPIGRSPSNFKLRSAEKGPRGLLREAVTDWELIGQSAAHAYLKLFPKTGRTHQLRVHLKSMSRPIVGDTYYAPPSLREGDSLGFTRLALHAYSLTVVLRSGEKKTFIAPIPLDFEQAETALATAPLVC
jgi:23S rRNA pseudouridine1911/1915/1917 synthase